MSKCGTQNRLVFRFSLLGTQSAGKLRHIFTVLYTDMTAQMEYHHRPAYAT